jgi:hypothetical protein
MKDILPKYFSSEWSFATCHVPSSAKFISTFGSEGENSVIAVAEDGSYYKFEFDLVTGGEAKRVAYRCFLRND